MRHPRFLALLNTVALGAAALTGVAAQSNPQSAEPTVEDVVITSPADGAEIHVSVHRPAGAAADTPVPMVLEGHGWGGSRQSDVTAFDDFLQAGFGVLSIDQRGHGESGGKATVMDPDFEGQDLIAIGDYVASLDWVARDLDADGNPIPDDPQLAAMGGSYGGGYQFLMALNETLVRGDTRIDVMAPQITWHDLNNSLAPNDVPRSAWLTALTGAGMASIDMADYIVPAFIEGAATGQYPDGTVPGTFDLKSEFAQHAPSWFTAQGIHLDIPVLFGQGHNDNLFNFNEAVDNFRDVLTPAAQEQSLLIGYQGGHALPNVAPLSEPDNFAVGTGVSDCFEDSFRALSIDFFRAAFAGEDPSALLPSTFNLTTSEGRCIHLDELATTETVDVGPVSMAATSQAGGAPINLPLTSGDAVTVAGIATLHGTITTAGVDSRLYFALARGRTPADARVIQNNVVPLRYFTPVVGEEFSIDLNGVAADLADGESLYLTISPFSDMFFGHGSRTPGLIVLEDLRVELPLYAPGT